MRLVFTLVLLAGTTVLAQQPPGAGAEDEKPQTRYGVRPKLKTYPQDTARKTLSSSIQAVENGDVDYLLAHLLDPGFVEFRLSERAKQFEAPVEIELSKRRDAQLRDITAVLPDDRIPTDRGEFRALIIEKSRELAFKQLVRDVEDKLRNDPQSFKNLRKMSRGELDPTPTGATLTHPDIPNRTVYFRKIGERWYLENQQEERPMPKPKNDMKN